MKNKLIAYRDTERVSKDLKKDADKNFHGSVVNVIRFAVRKHLYLKTKKR